jgi:AcrR family transcriptional regulator
LVKTRKNALEPRKSPVQARSTVTVDAIVQATVQVLLREGKEKLTTTLVARRAGVSVGTLYQYFPNKRALLQETLMRHVGAIADVVEQECRAQRGKSLEEMGAGVVRAFLAAKMKDTKTSVSLYAVSADVDGMKISRHSSVRTIKAIEEMLESAHEPLRADAHTMATVLQGALAGVGRSLVESPAPEKHFARVRAELEAMAAAYLCMRRT